MRKEQTGKPILDALLNASESFAEHDCRKCGEHFSTCACPTSTPNGFDPRWLPVINGVLEDRESDVRITDITGDLWDTFLGPMIDALEDRDGTFAEYESEAAQ